MIKIIKAIFLLLAVVDLLGAASSRINFLGKDYFIFGVNMGWLNRHYRNDFGRNEVYGEGPYYNSTYAETYLEDIRNMYVKVIRLWVFESYDGLMFSSTGTVTNIHPVMIANMDDFVSRCVNKGLYIYFCMISYNTNHADNHSWDHLDIVTNLHCRSNYIEHAFKPFISRYKSSPSFFAVDIMNEPEFVVAGLDGNWGSSGTTWTNMRGFLRDCRNAVKSLDPGILVSCGSGWHEQDNVLNGKYSGLGLDFYDYHRYDDTGTLVSTSSLPQDAPCIIGECGQRDKYTWSDSLQDTVGKNIMNNAWNLGYAGVLFWQYSEPGDPTVWNLINSDSSWRPLVYSIRSFSQSHCSAVQINESCTNVPEPLSKHYKFYFSGNPVNVSGSLFVYFRSDKEEPVSIDIYRMDGNKVKSLVQKNSFSRNELHNVEWKCDNAGGSKVLPGLYVLRFLFGSSEAEFKTIGVIK